MRYYCERCQTEIIFKETTSSIPDCPYCHDRELIIDIPNYETVEQWEKRTGEEYPDDGLVWWKVKDGLCKPCRKWEVGAYRSVIENQLHFYGMVVANPPVPPPDDWEPEK